MNKPFQHLFDRAELAQFLHGFLRTLFAILLPVLIAGHALAVDDDGKVDKPQIGDALMWMAQLGWAEKNCRGQMSPGGKALQSFVGKQFRQELLEEMLSFEDEANKDHRVWDRAETHDYECSQVERNFGDEGWSFPLLWIPAKKIKANTPLYKYGQDGRLSKFIRLGEFGKWGTVAQLGQVKCGLRPNALGETLIQGVAKILDTSQIYKYNPLRDFAPICDDLKSQLHRPYLNQPQLFVDREETVQEPTPGAVERPFINQARGREFRHGELVSRLSGEAVAPFQIKTTSGANYFFKLKNSVTNEVLSGFIVGGRDFETVVPLGAYELKYAAGQEWLDETQYFGEKTSYAIAKSTLTFQSTNNGYKGVSVELILQKNGNLETGYLLKEQF